MRPLLLLALPALLFTPLPAAPQASETPDLQEWEIEWGGRTRDPYVAPDGKVWFVGQAGNYIAYLDPATDERRRYEIEDGTNPHTLIVHDDGMVWYAGNRNGRIGKLDPATGELEIFMTGEARDPHTMMFDGNGSIWFTSQQSNRVGRLEMATGEVELVTPHENARARPYDIVLDGEGNALVALLGTNIIARVDRESMEVTHFQQAHADSRARRLDWTSDGMIWYGDEARGFLGRITPTTGEVKEWPMPGGADSRPYALTRDGQDRLWISETGEVKQLVGFNPETEEFFSVNPVSGTIRHMMFDPSTSAMWFGTDANQVGRVVTRSVVP
jgi:virginiamycin B lyase